MSVVDQAKRAGLVARAQNILLRPAAEWDVIDGEAATTQGLFTGYACILAILPFIGTLIARVLFAGLLGGMFGGMFGGGVGMMTALVGGLLMGVVGYVLSLAMVFVEGLIINALAPTFDAKPDPIRALKVAVYSSTAVWVAGLVSWIPVIGWLVGLVALGYGCYLLYLGVSKIMKPPADKAVVYAVVVIAIEIVIYFVIAWITAIVAAMAVFGAAASGATAIASAGHANLGALAAASQQLAAAAKQAETGEGSNGKIVAVDPEKLKTLLPDTVGGAARTAVTAVSAGAAGLGGSNAEGTYENGDAHATVTITDLAAAGGLAAMAGAVNVTEDKQTATGYEKAGDVDGRWTVEQYDSQSKSGEYTIIVASRFSVSAQGSGMSMDDLKAAVASVGPDRLQGLANG